MNSHYSPHGSFNRVAREWCTWHREICAKLCLRVAIQCEVSHEFQRMHTGVVTRTLPVFVAIHIPFVHLNDTAWVASVLIRRASHERVTKVSVCVCTCGDCVWTIPIMAPPVPSNGARADPAWVWTAWKCKWKATASQKSKALMGTCLSSCVRFTLCTYVHIRSHAMAWMRMREFAHFAWKCTISN